MKSLPAVVCAFVLCLASTTYGEFVFASSVNDSRAGVNNGGTLNNGIGAPNGTFVTETATASGTHQMDLIIGFTYTSGGATAPGITLYQISATGTVTLNFMSWGTDGTPGNSDDSGTFTLNMAMPATPTDLFVTGPANAFNSNFASANYTFVYMHFTLSDNAVLTVDAFSNPEPGTIALFALGAAGLGGFAMKRRRARLASRRAK